MQSGKRRSRTAQLGPSSPLVADRIRYASATATTTLMPMAIPMPARMPSRATQSLYAERRYETRNE